MTPPETEVMDEFEKALIEYGVLASIDDWSAPKARAAVLALHASALARAEVAEASFKNFHRSLCARFGYTHDERDWKRDQVSLEEHIAAKIDRPAEPPVSMREAFELWWAAEREPLMLPGYVKPDDWKTWQAALARAPAEPVGVGEPRLCAACDGSGQARGGVGYCLTCRGEGLASRPTSEPLGVPFAYMTLCGTTASDPKVCGPNGVGAFPVYAEPGGPVAAWDIMDERERQKSVEGWWPSHDDEHEYGELALAAACYAKFAGCAEPPAQRPMHRLDDEEQGPPEGWPWGAEAWKPKTRRRDLVRAGALIIAEIERLDRASRLTGGHQEKS